MNRSTVLFVAILSSLLATYRGSLEAQPAAIKCDTVFRIDGHASMFDAVGSVVAGPENQVVVEQKLSRRLRVFDSMGTEGPGLGRQGQGPGEFDALTSVGRKSDSVWAFDGRLERFTLFRFGEEEFKTYNRDQRGARAQVGSRLPSFALVLPLALYPDGAVLGKLLTPLSGDWEEDNTIGIVGPDGGLRRIVARYSGPEGFFRTATNGRTVSWNYPFEHRPQFDVASDGSSAALVVLDPVDNRHSSVVLSRFDATGDTTFTREIQIEGERIPAGERENALENAADRLLSAVGSGKWRQEYIQNDRTPAVYPPVSEVVVGSMGRTWLRVRRAGLGVEYLAFSTDGEIEGTLRLPENVRLVEARGSRLWAIEEDEYGVESLLGLMVIEG